jgi:hypothetical protein
VIYFIGESWSRPVKIGYSENPAKRLKQIQSINPSKLKILFTVEGGRSLEKQYHEVLGEHRVRGEWFDGRAAHWAMREVKKWN